ncbi:MAG: ADP-heptose--LPS heptosyltransferase [Desulfobulbus propionicus]|nr:MAG: ADP-heptose--LPS heptosyltransferase [Desulfobulbus propionicus]
MYRNLNNKRILIIKQSSLGDVVHTLPVAHALKRTFPHCEIGWVVEQGFAEILDRDKSVDHVYPIHIPSTSSPGAKRGVYARAFRASIQTLAFLRKQFSPAPYDLLLDLHASFRSGLISLMNPGGVRIGFADAREGNTLFQHELVANAEKKQHALEKNLLFCEHFSCTVTGDDLYMETGGGDRQAAKEFLGEHFITGSRPYIYANPTARWQTKFWRKKRWAQFADDMIQSGTQVVFGGSVHDHEYITAVVKQMKQPPVVSAGKLSIMQSAALMQSASLYVGLDTGPMHMAAMVGTPVVALFGPTHPERVGPYGVAHRIVRAQGVDCLCCRKRTCEKTTCMEAIGVEQVKTAVTDLLKGASNHAE